MSRNEVDFSQLIECKGGRRIRLGEATAKELLEAAKVAEARAAASFRTARTMQRLGR